MSVMQEDALWGSGQGLGAKCRVGSPSLDRGEMGPERRVGPPQLCQTAAPQPGWSQENPGWAVPPEGQRNGSQCVCPCSHLNLGGQQSGAGLPGARVACRSNINKS